MPRQEGDVQAQNQFRELSLQADGNVVTTNPRDLVADVRKCRLKVILVQAGHTRGVSHKEGKGLRLPRLSIEILKGFVGVTVESNRNRAEPRSRRRHLISQAPMLGRKDFSNLG